MNWKKGCAYIKSQFVEVFNGNRLYVFVTCAIDMENCKRVFKSVRDTILDKELLSDGL